MIPANVNAIPCDELQALHRVIEQYGHLLPTEAREDLEDARMEFACYVLGLRRAVNESAQRIKGEQ